MNFRTITFFAFSFFLLISSFALAEEEQQDSVKHKRHKKEMLWENVYATDSSIFLAFKRPMLELNFGNTNESIHKDFFSGKFNGSGLFELKLGNTNLEELIKDHSILKYGDNFIFFQAISNDLSTSKTNELKSINISCGRFGFGNSSGYGYNLAGSSGLILYHSSGLGWTKTNFKDTAQNAKDQDAINTYGSAFRFGTFFEGGIKLQLFKLLALKAGYERSVVFPRHLFWYWCGSSLVEAIGDGLVDAFIDPIFKLTPEAAPIIYFVLKNGFSYAIYELRRKNMNWPIQTISPFMIEAYKVGLSFTF